MKKNYLQFKKSQMVTATNGVREMVKDFVGKKATFFILFLPPYYEDCFKNYFYEETTADHVLFLKPLHHKVTPFV